MTNRRPARDPENAVEFDGVGRQFTVHHERQGSFQDWFLGRLRGRGPAAERFWALRDVTFAVRRGETVGLIGRNGAGKSTVLKLATSILEPTRGEVRISGRTYAMLELGAGFHPELSGRDNIFLSGALCGLGRGALRRKLEQIVEFAELERFIDTPVKHYSSGMFMRLGFATAISMDPEILVIDEVLSVGDHAFQRKCHDAIRDLQRRGVTILLVSHSGGTIREFCHRAVLLSGGTVVVDGDVEGVLAEYDRLPSREHGRGPAPPPHAERVDSNGAHPVSSHVGEAAEGEGGDGLVASGVPARSPDPRADTPAGPGERTRRAPTGRGRGSRRSSCAMRRGGRSARSSRRALSP